VLRILDALIYTDEHGGEVCPVNWHKGRIET
jgi:alkyl hydroperoxide reductase subunit AhpC